MNKRQRKKLCCSKCGNRMRQSFNFLAHRHSYNLCRVCGKNEMKIIREIAQELGNINPILGTFMNSSRMFQYGGLL